ncbi:MAG: glycoside hydrolase family 2 [Clostridiales bacterium]|nr:glycoside hydrolase family 2 [Clostridiales bacterium]
MKYNQLYTEWGENINPDKVLSEYPRPQLRRSNYTILNGYWNYNITKESVALKPAQYEGKILVPFSPESILSGVNRQLRPEELLWYERPLIIERIYPGKRLILHFGAVDQTCELLINNNRVTRHIGGYLPFSADITDYVIEGGNLLTVKVKDASDSSYHSRGKQKLKRGGMFYTAQSGIWQTVWMEWVPDIYIASLNITPLVKKSMVRLTVNLNQSPVHANKKDTSLQGRQKNNRNIFRVDIYDHGTKIHSFISKNHTMDIPIRSFTYWRPENPYLYDMVISSGDDVVQSYFAMRSVEIKQDEKGIKRIYLNDEEYFQNGLLDQGYWSDGLYTPPSDEAMIFDIEQAKALGFNMLRKHIKIEPQRWYYHCDRIGMLVWQDMVNGGGRYNKLLVGYLPTLFPGIAGRISDRWHFLFGRSNAEGRKEWTNECEETVRALYNHPSIIVWVPFNEGWGQFDAKKITSLIRSLDDTRLIDEASGWYDQKGGDFKSVHNYFHLLKYSPDRRGRAVILSEFGGYACYIAEHSYSPMLYGYRIYMNSDDLEAALQKLYQENIMKLKEEGVSAVVYTQLSDIEDEVNGLFTYDRRVCKISKALM